MISPVSCSIEWQMALVINLTGRAYPDCFKGSIGKLQTPTVVA
jgi:hypothetical protein